MKGAQLLALVGLLTSCAPSVPIDVSPTPRPTPLPTRIVTLTSEARPSPTTVGPTPTPAVVRRYFSPSDFDPYAALYVSEREGIYTTTKNPRGRYYYKWDDRRWRTVANRVWFRTVEDLLTVFPGREPAP